MVTHHHHTQVATSTSDHGPEKTAEPSSVALRPLHGEDVSVKPRNKRSYMAGGVDCVNRAKYFQAAKIFQPISTTSPFLSNGFGFGPIT